MNKRTKIHHNKYKYCSATKVLSNRASPD